LNGFRIQLGKHSVVYSEQFGFIFHLKVDLLLYCSIRLVNEMPEFRIRIRNPDGRVDKFSTVVFSQLITIRNPHVSIGITQGREFLLKGLAVKKIIKPIKLICHVLTYGGVIIYSQHQLLLVAQKVFNLLIDLNPFPDKKLTQTRVKIITYLPNGQPKIVP